MASLTDAFVQFFDDVRYETGNKVTYVGLFGDIALLSAELPDEAPAILHKLWMVITLRWKIAGDDPSVGLRVKMSTGEVSEVPLPWPPPATPDAEPDAISTAQLHMPFLGMPVWLGRPIEAWVTLGERTIFAGHLKFERQPQPLETPAASPTAEEVTPRPKRRRRSARTSSLT